MVAFFRWQLDPAYKCISSPSDTLQYLSQLESVARKLKDQLIRQNQVSFRRCSSRISINIRKVIESASGKTG